MADRHRCFEGRVSLLLVVTVGIALALMLSGCDRDAEPEVEANPRVQIIEGKYCGYLDVDIVDDALAGEITRAEVSRSTVLKDRMVAPICFITDDDEASPDYDRARVSTAVWAKDTPEERQKTRDEIQEGLDGYAEVTCVDHPRFADLGIGHACPGRSKEARPDFVTVLILFDDGPSVLSVYSFRSGTAEEAYDTAIDIAVNARDNLEVHNPWAEEFGPDRSGRN